jgi:hypothetical protein
MQMGYDFDDQMPGPGLQSRIARFEGDAGHSVGRGAEGEGDSPDTASPVRTPDWLALRARFLAIHALRRSLEQGDEPVLLCGGFQAEAEAVLSSCRPNRVGVNQFCSANGKEGGGMVFPVAAPPPFGVRGLR